MKKLLIIFIALFAIACDSRNQSTSRGAASEREDATAVDPTESDTSSIHADTTTSGGMNRQNQYDTLQ